MECVGSDCTVAGTIKIRYCDDNNTWFVFENRSNGVTQLKVAATSLCVEWKGGKVRIVTCDASQDHQKFTAGNGSFNGKRFELMTSSGGCLTQQHHPKDGEEIINQVCATPRRSDTSYWNKY